ncbi:MAG: NADH:ubiquinone reductase (Na(+)-transporting) subunit F [Verrucomicrobia bacterium]|nr:NADH:ubiquinone reductase (Na(+)-transporting) subunit F [Verrucomicrobiota bacterium]
MRPPDKLDYSLVGENARRAVEMGLAEAEWYQCPVPRAVMRDLLERRDGPAIRDTLIWFGLILGFAAATTLLWGSAWAILPYLAFATLYASTSDSRWHESSHGTAFKTDWMNNTLYEIASFMVRRESTVWRWSHTRHHSDTIIVGRDPEIAVPRPPDLKSVVLGLFNVGVIRTYFPTIVSHSFGRMTPEEKTFIPESEFPKVYFRARIYVGIYVGVIVLSLALRSWLPVFLIILPHVFGSWLMSIYGLTQHAGLAENVLDHRLNCRTVYMNPVNRFLYWNMNYHVEHHMFPLVPYHRLPELHEAVKDDCPEPYPDLITAWKEIIPAVRKQVKDPAYHVKRKLPPPKARTEEAVHRSDVKPDSSGWLEICAGADLANEDVIRFDHGRKTFAIYRDDQGKLFATDGICTHGNTHLADGLVKGGIIECPKHNGRFNLEDGSPARAPVCRGLATYPVEEREGRIWLNLLKPGGAGARAQQTLELQVVSNRNVATFIKELVLEPVDPETQLSYKPGDYLQIDIPAYERIRFRDFEIPEPFAAVWARQHVFDLEVSHPGDGERRNNYSLAGNPLKERQLKFNVRIATPPPGQDCPPGVGSSYGFNLKPGDRVTAIGPFGDFHIKPTQKEMIYIGGGAGMAPLRAHIAQLFENENTARRVSFWYGARSRQELYYTDYFEGLSEMFPNFSFHPALSELLPEDEWDGLAGFIHNVVEDEYLKDHDHLNAVEFYLCGPPQMIKACIRMLHVHGVSDEQIAFDEF